VLTVIAHKLPRHAPFPHLTRASDRACCPPLPTPRLQETARIEFDPQPAPSHEESVTPLAIVEPEMPAPSREESSAPLTPEMPAPELAGDEVSLPPAAPLQWAGRCS